MNIEMHHARTNDIWAICNRLRGICKRKEYHEPLEVGIIRLLGEGTA
jgi:hypothetical protein